MQVWSADDFKEHGYCGIKYATSPYRLIEHCCTVMTYHIGVINIIHTLFETLEVSYNIYSPAKCDMASAYRGVNWHAPPDSMRSS